MTRKSQFAAGNCGKRYGRRIDKIKIGSATSAVKSRLFIKFLTAETLSFTLNLAADFHG
jgi:hypothetical protein